MPENTDDIDWDAILADLPVAVPGAGAATPPPVAAVAPAPVRNHVEDDEEDDLDSFMDTAGLQTQGQVDLSARDLNKPWMQFHNFVLVKTVDEVRELIDAAFAHGRCALDTETQGLDSRIDYDAEGQPHTKHKIVGYCIGLKGVGYYIPVRHVYDKTYGAKDPNVSVKEVEAEIRRLCLGSQPILSEEGLAECPYSSMKWETPPRIILYFWNAKFDQEMLFPITGIDFWHPASFEDGMLAAYAIYSDDLIGLKEQAPSRLTITDPEKKDQQGNHLVYPYSMIKFEELFAPGVKKSAMKIADLYPEDGSAVVRYGCSDGICTELICETKKVAWEFAKQPKSFEYKEAVSEALAKHEFTYKLERQTAQAVRIMERSRQKIDKEELSKLLIEAEAEKKIFQEKIQKLAASRGVQDFNPGSSQQLSEFLFGKSGLDINPKPKKSSEGSEQYKTDAATLEQMHEAHPEVEVLDWIVKYRQIDKIIGTYLTSLVANCDENQCLRFNFKQVGAATGRFTAPAGEPEQGFSGIPIQGIPARSDPKKPKVAHSLRRMFIARAGYTLVKIDYAGQELRIVTNLSKEPLWLNEFRSAATQGKEADLHTLTAQAFFGEHITKEHKLERNMAKIANFSLIYGGGVQAIQRATKCDKVEAARRKSNFDKSVPIFAKWVGGQHAFVKKNGGVFTAFKRFIRIPDANVKPGDVINGQAIDEHESRRIRAGCERKSTNYPIQGSGADIMKIALVRLVKELGRRGWLKTGGDDSVRIVMTVHDELVFEVLHERLMEVMPLLISVMESPGDLCRWEIPLIVEPIIGLNWEAPYDWLKILKGSKPVPDWLTEHVTPGGPLKLDLGLPAPAGKPQNKVELKFEAKPASNGNGKKTAPVVTFVLPKDYLTRESIRLVMMAISGAIPLGKARASALRLRVKDQQGNLLVDPKLGIHVDPERFARELQDRNLGGKGGWDIEDENL